MVIVDWGGDKSTLAPVFPFASKYIPSSTKPVDVCCREPCGENGEARKLRDREFENEDHRASNDFSQARERREKPLSVSGKPRPAI